MTIDARAIEDRGDLRRHLGARKDCLRFVDGRIRSGRPHDLYEDEKADDNDQHPLDYFPEGLHVCLWRLLANSPDPDALPITTKPGTIMP
jgi:hypothetical protein